MTSHNDERVHDRRHPRHRRRLAMTRDSLALTIGQNESVLLGGFLGRRDDASPIHQMSALRHKRPLATPNRHRTSSDAKPCGDFFETTPETKSIRPY